MSRILTYSKVFTSIGELDSGEIILNQSLQLDNTKKTYIKLISGAITSRIANVFNYGGINNGLLRVSNDNGVSWTVIQLNDGVYSSPTVIQNAINSAVEAWWTNLTDPGILIYANYTLGKAYIILDSAKLSAPGQLQIDLAYNGSRIWELLGFTVTTLFTVDGTYTATENAQFDWIGNRSHVYLDGFGTISIKNSNISNQIYSVPLAVSDVSNNYNFPSIEQPYIQLYTIPSIISYWRVYVLGSRSNRKAYALEGEFEVTIEIMQQ